MDNIEQTNEPSEVEGATSPADTSSFDTQPAESTDSVSDGTVEDAGEAPQLLAGKFKDAKSLETAYSELQSKLGETSQKAEIANLLEKSTGMNAQQIKEYLNQQEQQAQRQRYADNPLAPVLDKVTYLEQQLQQQQQEKAMAEVQKDINSFIKINPAYEAHQAKIEKLALTPGIGFNPETGEEVPIEDLAREYFGEARAQGQQDAYRKIDKKVMTQATGASQAPPKGKLTLDDMKNLSSKEMETLLPWADISNRV